VEPEAAEVSTAIAILVVVQVVVLTGVVSFFVDPVATLVFSGAIPDPETGVVCTFCPNKAENGGGDGDCD
jgi:hypothetical protein